jgi:hypothetical protein
MAVEHVIRDGRRIEVETIGRAMPKGRRADPKLEGQRHIGCSVRYLRAAIKATKSSNRLAVALYLYRLYSMQNSRTVRVPNGWLERALGINRMTKGRALNDLAKAGVIELHDRSLRKTSSVTLLVV